MFSVFSVKSDPSQTSNALGQGAAPVTSLEEDGLVMFDKALVNVDGVIKEINFCVNEEQHIDGCEAAQREDSESSGDGTFHPIWHLWSDDAQDLLRMRKEEIVRGDIDMGLVKLEDHLIICLCGRKAKSVTVFGYFIPFYLEHMIVCKAVQTMLRERLRTIPQATNNRNRPTPGNRASQARNNAVNPSSSPRTSVIQSNTQSGRGTAGSRAPEGDQRKRTDKSIKPTPRPSQVRDKSPSLNDERRAALQALPYVGRINPSWAECTACDKKIQLGRDNYRSGHFERHTRTKAHLEAVAKLKSKGKKGPPGAKAATPSTPKHASNTKQVRPGTQSQNRKKNASVTDKTSGHSLENRESGSKGNDVASASATGTGTRVSSRLLQRKSSSAPGASNNVNPTAIRFEAGGEGRMAGIVTIDGQRRKVIECTISEGFAPKTMDISLTF